MNTKDILEEKKRRFSELVVYLGQLRLALDEVEQQKKAIQAETGATIRELRELESFIKNFENGEQNGSTD